MIDDETINRLIRTLEDSNKKTIEEANRKQSQEINLSIKKELNEIKLHIEEEYKKKSVELEKNYKNLKIKYEKLDKELRKNNIIIFGLDSPKENFCQFVINEINQRLGITLTTNDINNTYTIGKETKKRPIIVKLMSYLKKNEILKNCKKLKGTSISIVEELTVEEREENKVLRAHLKKARSKKINAFIRNRKLIINGEQYSAQELQGLEENTDTEDIVEEESVKEDQQLNNIKKNTKLNCSDTEAPKRILSEEFEPNTKEEEGKVRAIDEVQGIDQKKTEKNIQLNTITRTSNRLIGNKDRKRDNISTNLAQFKVQ